MERDRKEFYKRFVKSSLLAGESDRPLLLDGGKHHFMIPMTYVTPSYLAVQRFAVVSALTNLGNSVSIFLHDNNILAHKHPRRMSLKRTKVSLSSHVEDIVDEIMLLLVVLGANLTNVKIIRSSDAWATISQNKADFFAFYELLGEVKLEKMVEEEGKFYSAAYHAIQKPFDMYFANNCARLSKVVEDNPDFIIAPADRAEVYKYIRSKMLVLHNGGDDDNIVPALCHTKQLANLQHKDSWPSCNMSLGEIGDIVGKARLAVSERANVSSAFVAPMSEFLQETSLLKKPVQTPKNPSDAELAEGIHTILNAITCKARDCTTESTKEVLVNAKFDFQEVRTILASKTMLKTLLYCNGELTNSEIARKLGLQLSNVSTYINKMRKLSLVTTDTKPKIKFSRLIIDVDALMKNEDSNTKEHNNF